MALSITDHTTNTSRLADVPRDDVSQAKPGNVQKIKPVEVPKEETRKEEPKKPLYTGPLTFHEELLKTNPVKALRLQTEERGHWSAKWIPPFPPDDEEAAAIARDLYLITYYESIGDTNNSICQKALRRYEAMLIAHSKKIEEWSDRRTAIPFEDAFANTEEYQQVKWEGARMNDLARVMWARVTEGLILNPARFARKTLLPNLE